MKVYIGELEEIVLLTVSSLGSEAYGAAIREDIQTRSGRNLSLGALHSTIARLEDKKLIRSWLGEPTQIRGGRRKRIFEVTQTGKAALREIKHLRDELWELSKARLAPSR